MKNRILLTLLVFVAGLSAMAFDTGGKGGQNDERNARAEKRQKAVTAWKQDMEKFRARTEKEHQLDQLADSLAGVQATAALKNRDFVLEADNVSFKNGMTAFVNSTTNFISVKGNRAVVQISPSNFSSGPNGLGGVTVDGTISGVEIRTDKKGGVTYSMNVMGIGINAQVEIYTTPGTNRATATVYPNFNSNTVWMEGNIVPYENSTVIEGSSL